MQSTAPSTEDVFPSALVSEETNSELISAENNSDGKKQFHVRFKDCNVNDDNTIYETESRPVTYSRPPLSNVETFLHLFKSLLGTGILAMPKAFFYAGWAFGVIGSILIAIISTYCVHLLLKSQNEMCRRLNTYSLSYSETARIAMLEGPMLCARFAKGFGFLTSLFLVVDQIGTCCIYVIFVAYNLKGVVDQYMEPLDIRLYMALLLVPLLLVNYIRNLKYLTPFSTIANLVMLISFGITFYYVFSDMPHVTDRKVLGSAVDFPLFVGMVLFSMEAIGVILPLRNEMKTPKAFGGICGILNQVMIILTLSYITIGFFGYVKYGDRTKGSITLNLPDEDGLAQSVRILLSCSVLLSHGLQCYVIIDILWNENLSHKLLQSRWKIYLEHMVRTAVVVITILLAIAIPNLEIFISLVGALCVTVLAILFPVIMDTLVFWHWTAGAKFYIMCIKNAVLALFGIFALIVGVYTSLIDLFKLSD